MPLDVSVPVIVGPADTTKVDPVPVCDAIAVALPVDVIGPVKFAFVVTVEAAMAVLHPNPVPLVHWSALALVEHDGTLCPLGVVAVSAPRSWLAERVGSCE